MATSHFPGVEGEPGGSDTQVQFNDHGAFSGDGAFTFNKTTGLMTVSSAIGAAAFLTPDQTTAHTGVFQAYDVDGAAYKTFATLTNGNTPDFSILPPVGGTITLQASTFKSSDGSTGATGTATAVNTLTVKNGLIVTIA